MDEQTFKKLLDETISPLREEINELKDFQKNRLLPSVIETEVTVKSYADSYKENQKNIERLDTRLDTVEDKLGIEPPEDLKVPHFSNQS